MAIDTVETLNTELNGIIWIFHLVGLQYFTVNLKYKTFQRFYALQFLALFVVFLCVLAALNFGFYYFNEREYEDVSKVDLIVVTLEKIADIAFFVTAYASVIQAFLTREREAKIYKNILTVSIMMAKVCNHKVNFSVFFKHFKIKMGIILIFDLIGCVTMFTLDIMEISSEEGYNWKCMGLPFMINLFISFKFVFIVDLLRFLLKNLKDQLEKSFFTQYPMLKVVDRYEFSLYPDVSCEKLAGLKEIYGVILECSQLINECLGWSMLCLFVTSCIKISLMAYYEFIFATSDDPKFLETSGKINIVLT